MDWGLKNRISRIINPTDGKGVMLAVDHGYFLGPTEKLESPSKTIRPLLKYCDSLMLTRGTRNKFQLILVSFILYSKWSVEQ